MIISFPGLNEHDFFFFFFSPGFRGALAGLRLPANTGVQLELDASAHVSGRQ